MATIKQSQYARYVKWSEMDQEYVAIFIEIPGLSGLGLTILDALQELDDALDAWIKTVGESEIPPASPLGPVIITDPSQGNEDTISVPLQNVGSGTGKHTPMEVDASKGIFLELEH